MTCRHSHLKQSGLDCSCYHCGQEFENPWVWKYGPLWLWAVSESIEDAVREIERRGNIVGVLAARAVVV